MRVTQILLRQHIGRDFTRHWRIQGKRKILETGAEQILKEKFIPVCKPEDLLFEKREFEKVEIIGLKPKPIPLDQTNPNWHSRTLLTYKDNNVLLEGLTQAKVLTKSVEVKDGLPESIVLRDVPKNINKLTKQIILGSHVFDAEQKKLPKIKDPERPAWNFPRVYGITADRVNKLITSKLLQMIECSSDDNIVKNRYLFNDLHFSYPFEKDGELIQFQLRGDTLITASKPLSPVSKDYTEDLKLPDIFPVKHTITLNEENIYELKNIYPIKQTVQKNHPHTVFVHYNPEEVKNLFEEEVLEPQIYGRSLLKTFTVAASYAKQKYGENVRELVKPVTLQCVQTDGKFFHFGILQLNTLDLGEGGSKNVWYQTDRIPLFETCCYQKGKPVLEGYNSEVIKHLYAFYNNV